MYNDGTVMWDLEYDRYTEIGTGPKRAIRKVGDKMTQSLALTDYVLLVGPEEYGRKQTTREHLGTTIGEPVKCVIVAITRRRKMQGGHVYYADSWHKLRTPGGTMYWTTGGSKRHVYKKIGMIEYKDYLELENKLAKVKVEYHE